MHVENDEFKDVNIKVRKFVGDKRERNEDRERSPETDQD